MLGCFVLAITVVSAFTLSSRREIAARSNTVEANRIGAVTTKPTRGGFHKSLCLWCTQPEPIKGK